MGILLFGLLIIVVGVLALAGNKKPFDDSARTKYDSLHRRFPFVFEDADFYEGIRYPLNLIAIGLGCCVLVVGAISLLT